MDPQGSIYDMQANFIGTANTDGLGEIAEAANSAADTAAYNEQKNDEYDGN